MINYKQLVNYVSLLAGIFSFGISIFFTVKWLKYTGMDWFITYPLAFSYIAFLNIMFERGVNQIIQGVQHKKTPIIAKNIILDKLKEKNPGLLQKFKIQDKNNEYTKLDKKDYFKAKKYVLGGLLMFSWFILSIYSMVSTVAGQYDQLVKAEDTRTNKDYTINNDETILNNYNEDIKNLQQEKEDLRIELNPLLKRNATVENMDTAANYKSTLSHNEDRISEIRKRTTEINNKIREISMQKNDLLKVNKSLSQNSFKVNFGSIYNYFAHLMNNKVQPIIIQFFLAIYPSIFVDIISPVSFSIYIYNRKEKLSANGT